MEPLSRAVLSVLLLACGLAKAADDGTGLKNIRPKDLSGGPAPAAGAIVHGKSAKDSVNLMYQFPDAPDRNQQDVGDCHVFASIGLLEAAYYRQYHETVRLSEVDLFVNRTVLGGALGGAIYGNFGATASSGASGKVEFEEGGYPVDDIQFALDHGVATDAQYGTFVQRYRQFRKNVTGDMAHARRVAAQEWSPDTWLAPFISKFTGTPEQAYLAALNTPESQAGLKGYLEGHAKDRALQDQRDEMRKKFAGFRVVPLNFDYLGQRALRVPASICASIGASRGQDILHELKAGRPVGVAMTLKGLDGWGLRGATTDANHAFDIVGYDSTPSGTGVFKTRNSWGGNNPDVHENELCRIFQLISVRAPSDR